MLTLTFLCVLTVSAVIGWVVIQIGGTVAKYRERRELVIKLLAMKRIQGEDKDIIYVCDGLLTEEEYLIQLMTGGRGITFGAGGTLTMEAAPEFEAYGNTVNVTMGKNGLEFMRFNNGKDNLLRVTRRGSRGASTTLLEVDEWVLLRVMTTLGIVTEERKIEY